MISIKMRGDQWRLIINNEELQFENEKELKKTIDLLIELKKKNGDIENRRKHRGDELRCLEERKIDLLKMKKE